MTALWAEHVRTALPEAEFHIYTAAEGGAGRAAPGTLAMGRVPRGRLITAMKEASVCLIPGHADETFCLAAAECIAMGVPVVTYGTGALKERVQDGINGYIATSREDFAAKILHCLKNEGPWTKRQQTTQENTYRSWDQIADLWLDLFRRHGLTP